MNEIIKMLRGIVIVAITYFGALYLVDKYLFKVIDSTAILIGIIIPAGMLGLALGSKFKKKT